MFITAVVSALGNSIRAVAEGVSGTARTLTFLSFKRMGFSSYEKESLSKDRRSIQNDFMVIGNDMRKSIKKYSSNKGNLKYE